MSKGKSFFETPLMRTKIKTAGVSLFPEALLGYLVGPILALMSNAIVSVWLVQYWDKVLGFGDWAPLFQTLVPIISAVLIILGNLLVGKLMERKPSLAGKARPLVLLAMPAVAIALLMLFVFVPFPDGATADNPNVLTMVLVAIGYNLFYAVAWPLYFTSHSALVNLSTRDGDKRGLLSTAAMAAQLGASGLAGMAGGLLVDLLGLMPVYTYINGTETITVNAIREIPIEFLGSYTTVITPDQANQKWIILMIVMVACLVVGCLLEYFFTRERITEETIMLSEASRKDNAGEAKEEKQVKKVSMGEQAKICLKDKFWWIIIIFFFLYQFGGQMKNNDMSFFSQAFTGGTSVSSLINTVGAAPTAIGMVLVWPIAAKITKSKTIVWGGFLAFIGAAIGFLPLLFPENIAAVSATAVGAFCVKALGTAPAMYISLAVMAAILDHQEAVHGVRTDGFTMAVYGSIMVAMSGVCNGIIVGIDALIPAGATDVKQFVHTFLAYGVEGICYLVMSIMFFFMKVEKFERVDKKAIAADQKEKVLAEGGVWVEPEERAKLEAEENARIVEEQKLAQLKLDCEKKHLDYDAELAKYNEDKAKKEADKAAKDKAAADKKAAKEAALSDEQKKAAADKKAAKEAKQAENDAEALAELNKTREKFGNHAIA